MAVCGESLTPPTPQLAQAHPLPGPGDGLLLSDEPQSLRQAGSPSLRVMV